MIKLWLANCQLESNLYEITTHYLSKFSILFFTYAYVFIYFQHVQAQLVKNSQLFQLLTKFELPNLNLGEIFR